MPSWHQKPGMASKIVDIINNPDFQRLQALEMAQGQELNEFHLSISKSISELSSQISILCSDSTLGKPKDPDPSIAKSRFIDQWYLSTVDLDRPNYAKPFMDNEDYMPCKNLKVFMPKVDGTKAEEWLYQVKIFFIYNKTPKDQKLLIVSFHVEGLARKWFAWMEVRGLLTD